MNGKRGNPLWLWAGILLLAVPAAPAGGAVELVHSVQGWGGGSMSGSSYRLSGTLGEPGAELLTAPGYKAGIGFWYLLSLNYVSALPELLVPSRLDQNAPNPFNPSTIIRFAVGKSGPVKLKLYDLRGHLVATLLEKEMPIGEHALVFEPRGLASGVYLYRLRTPDKVLTRRLTLVK